MTKEEIAAKWSMKYHDRLTTCIDAVLGAMDEYAGSDQFKQPRIKIPNITYLKEIAELRECFGELVSAYESVFPNALVVTKAKSLLSKTI